MEQIDRMINAENIGRHIDQLYRELEPERQARLQRALLDEENRYGFCSWQLDLLGSISSKLRIVSTSN